MISFVGRVISSTPGRRWSAFFTVKNHAFARCCPHYAAALSSTLSLRCLLPRLPSPSAALILYWPLPLLPSTSPALSLSCPVSQLPSPLPALSLTCPLPLLISTSTGLSLTCPLPPLPCPSPALSLSCPLPHLASPSTGPSVITFPTPQALLRRMPFCPLCCRQDNQGRGHKINALEATSAHGVDVIRSAFGVVLDDTAYLCLRHIGWLRVACETASSIQSANPNLVIPSLQPQRATRGSEELRLSLGRTEHRVPDDWKNLALALMRPNVADTICGLYLSDRSKDTGTNGVLREAINGCVHAAVREEAANMCSDKVPSAFHTQPTRDMTKLGPDVMINNMCRDLHNKFSTFYGVLLAGLTREKPKGTFYVKGEDTMHFALVNIAATLLCERSERMGQLPLMKALLARDAGETKHGQNRASIFKDQAVYRRTLDASHELRDDPRVLLSAWRAKREEKMTHDLELEIRASRDRLEVFMDNKRGALQKN
jgi:hypothetical protein